MQKTIDRILSLRICEDRGVEQYGNLKNAIKKGDLYKNLFEFFHIADEKYNSGLFDFKEDNITPILIIDNKVIKNIIRELYYPHSPFEFSVLPADILGSVYEQFLGKTIRLTKAHQAKIEEKPEVRKAGGVYYTPKYIVDYIVENTVGKLLKGKTPKQAEKIKICDPACGSGSFLIGAYQYLLDWHLKYYTGNPPKKKKDNPLTPDGNLTTAEKKRILINNIYGVDIDPQAAEVTKLNLLLKALEGETQASISKQLTFFNERVLPNLGDNIKCGNSLIGNDFYDNQLDLFPEQIKKINAFDWKDGFPEIFAKGGFDAVIGNPPYGAEFTNEEKIYLYNKYPCQSYQLDSYMLFLELSMKKIINVDGLYGMIIPNPWLTNLKQFKIRKYIFSNCSVKQIVHFKYAVFPKVTVDTQIVIFQNGYKPGSKAIVKVVSGITELETGLTQIIYHNPLKWKSTNGSPVNIFISNKEEAILQKCQNGSNELSKYLAINVGIKPYQSGKGKPPQTKKDVKNRIFDSTKRIDKNYRQYLRGKDINRYIINPIEKRYIKYGVWLAEPRPTANFDAPIKIFMRQTGDSLIGTIDTNQYLCLNNMHVLVPEDSDFSHNYFLGLINSKLMNWYYQRQNPEVGEALAEVKKTYVAKLPIKNLKLWKVKDKKLHDSIVKLVDNLLKLNNDLQSTKLETQRKQLQRAINHSERRIDELVYEIYGINKQEIQIINNN